MGKTILTSKQLNFLELAQAQAYIAKNFYLTCGTALSEFYFKHRLSEDIDLFSEKEVKPHAVEPFLKAISPKLGISKIIKENFLGLYTYKLHFKDKAKFDWPLEAKNLAAAFLKVKDSKRQDFPKMLIPFDKGKMEEFFLALAKSLEPDIFKN